MDPVSARNRAPDRTLPVNLLLKGRLCLVVGAGSVACRKVRTLVDHGARVRVVAPEIHAELRALAAEGRVELEEARFDEAHLAEPAPFLVYAATDDDALNREVAACAERRGILVTSVSSWRVGDFISPATVRWGPGQVSVTTEGASCRYAKFMRERLEDHFAGARSWLYVSCASAPLEPGVLRALGQLAALEEYTLVEDTGGARLYAWAADDDVLVGAVLRMLGWTAHRDRVVVERGDAVVRRALREGGEAFRESVDRAVERGSASIHLEALRRQVQEVGAHA